MKKILALLMSVVVFSGLMHIDFNRAVFAKSTEEEVENAIKTAIQWKSENDNPFDSVGEEASDIYVTALARGGIEFDYDKYLDGLDEIAQEYSKSTNIFDVQRTLMTVVAAGGDGQYFGGKDLVANATYFKEDLGYSGILEYINALNLLDAGKFEVNKDWAYNTKEDMIYAIIEEQKEDGSFGDIYTTAFAIIALSPYNNDYEYSFTTSEGEIISESCGNVIYKAVKFLSEQQSEYGDFYTSIDTAAVCMAMDSIGLKEDDERFVKGNNTVMDGLLTYRNEDGGFTADYNETDGTSTSYALCALISNIRVREDKADFFDFTVFDSINLDENNNGIVRPFETQKPQATTKVSKTTAPKVTLKPKITMKPQITVRPKVTLKPTVKPTRKPDLVGPMQLVGPEEPVKTFMPSQTIMPNENTKNRNTVILIILIFVSVISAIAVVCLVLLKNSLKEEVNKKIKSKIYKSKPHTRTEKHRNYEERRKYDSRRKYNKRRR